MGPEDCLLFSCGLGVQFLNISGLKIHGKDSAALGSVLSLRRVVVWKARHPAIGRLAIANCVQVPEKMIENTLAGILSDSSSPVWILKELFQRARKVLLVIWRSQHTTLAVNYVFSILPNRSGHNGLPHCYVVDDPR